MQHQRSKHRLTPAVTKLHTCFMCSMEFEKKSPLTHYENEHSIEMKKETLSFSILEVMTWKESLEKDIKCKYTVDRRTKVYAGLKRYFYKCYRSGSYESKSDGIRHLNTLGSKKINFLCPSSIKISEASDRKCDVEYIKSHIGHEMELKHFQLPSSERESLAEMLGKKIPLYFILDNVRETLTESGLQKLHLLKSKTCITLRVLISLIR